MVPEVGHVAGNLLTSVHQKFLAYGAKGVVLVLNPSLTVSDADVGNRYFDLPGRAERLEFCELPA